MSKRIYPHVLYNEQTGVVTYEFARTHAYVCAFSYTRQCACVFRAMDCVCVLRAMRFVVFFVRQMRFLFAHIKIKQYLCAKFREYV